MKAMVFLGLLFSSIGFSKTKDLRIASSYSDLLPKASLSYSTPAESGSQLGTILQDYDTDFNACLSLLNSSEARKGDGAATAHSGYIQIGFYQVPSKVREVDVISSAFRYDPVEACLVRALKNVKVPSEYSTQTLNGQVEFHLSCNLRKLSDSAWLPNGQVERKCSLAWKIEG